MDKESLPRYKKWNVLTKDPKFLRHELILVEN